MANRTKKGNVTSEAREKHGNRKGKFPIFDEKSALSAIKLRGHADNPDSVLRRAAAWARRNNNKRVLAAVQKARSK